MYINEENKEMRKKLLYLLEKKNYKYKGFKRDTIINSELPIHIYISTKEIGMIGSANILKISKIKYTDYDKAIELISKKKA